MIRQPPRSTRTEHTLSLHNALPISTAPRIGISIAESGPDNLCHSAPSSVLVGRPAASRSSIASLSAPNDNPSALILESVNRSEEHTSELQSLMRISYAVFCLKKINKIDNIRDHTYIDSNIHTHMLYLHQLRNYSTTIYINHSSRY